MTRPRSQPPTKFAFLSGIHPDLDDALCEADLNAHAYYEDDGGTRDRGLLSTSSKHLKLQTPHYDEQIPYENRRSSAGSRVHDAMYESSHSVASRPREITCTLNKSIESMPFSIDGMERAKRKIQSQAAKIRDLEDKLQRAVSSGSVDISEIKPGRKILSPEERLEAHKERKRVENMHKEKSGKWASPPPLKRQSLTSKVKRKDDFVDRLGAEPKERRRQDEIKRKLSRSMRKTSGHTLCNGKSRDSSPLMRRHCLEEEIRELSAKKKKKGRNNIVSNRDGRGDLMKRLNMGVEERRDLEQKENGFNAAVRLNKNRPQRSPRGSCIDNEKATSRKSTNKELDFYGETTPKNSIRCQTCGSTQNCEEDTDDPGTFYCSLCWEEYENDCDSDQGFDDDGDEEDESLGEWFNQSLHQRAADHALWIVHDNPKLGNRLVCSGPKKMSCFVETKDPEIKNCMRIIHGTIDYSGPVVNSGGRTIRNVKETERGAECIRLGSILGFVVRHDKIQTRLAADKSVFEFKLDKDEGIQLTGVNAQMSVKDFFKGCVGAVDVILDPQCSAGSWYPIREASSTSRKIAPQFRSKGIGYIRLGDDMGNHGQAFMSNDCCKTFLFNDPVEHKELNLDLLKTVSSFSSKRGYNTRSPRQMREKQNLMKSHNCARPGNGTVRSSRYQVMSDEDDDSSISSNSSECEVIHAGEVLKELQNIESSKDMKWKDKADLLIKLGKAVSRPQGRSWCEGALNYIQDIISAKNVNIHVLRSALLVVNKIGSVLQDELPNHIAWKTILIETLKLLKNKQCGGGARDILQKLHGNCYTLANSLTSISHVLGIGKTLSTSQRKLNTKKGGARPQVNSNNIEVIEWLAVTTESERLLGKVNPSMDESELELLASFFLNHESHRDARCRKNALDGLLHTMLYGLDVLGMDLEAAQSLCIELKTSKPKSWTRLIKSLHMVLKAERVR